MRDYRAQFPISTPAGFRDEPAEYFFDPNSISALNSIILAGQQLNNIALVQSNSQQGTFEYDFLLRAIQVGDPTNSLGLGVRFRDALGNYLSNDYEPIQFYHGLNLNAQLSAFAEVNEPELLFPAGAVFLVDLANLSSSSITIGISSAGGSGVTFSPFPILLKGVHRFPRGGDD